MRRLPGRLALLVLLLAGAVAIGATAFLTFRSTRNDRAALSQVDASVRRIQTAIADTRAGMYAYVAVGQSDDAWSTRIGNDFKILKEELAALHKELGSATALNDADGASSAIEAVSAVNDRVHRLLRNGQMSQASDVIFGDGTENLTSAAARIDTAWQAEYSLTEARISNREQRLGVVTGGSAALIGLIATLLLLAERKRDAMPEAVREDSKALTDEATSARESPGVSNATVKDAPLHGQVLSVPSDVPLQADESKSHHDRRKATELKAMADLCTDFARLGDSDELPPLLERAARLIDASGFIVWVANPKTDELSPALAHGYTAQALSRLPGIPRTADNATAAAWREVRMQSVKTNGMTPGALVTPLLTAKGCLGVLATEIRHGRESSESVRALTRILAAQLSTLVAPAASADDKDAESRSQKAHG